MRNIHDVCYFHSLVVNNTNSSNNPQTTWTLNLREKKKKQRQEKPWRIRARVSFQTNTSKIPKRRDGDRPLSFEVNKDRKGEKGRRIKKRKTRNNK